MIAVAVYHSTLLPMFKVMTMQNTLQVYIHSQIVASASQQHLLQQLTFSIMAAAGINITKGSSVKTWPPAAGGWKDHTETRL